MYDTSDIRKGLKIMIDGAPYTVVEFQFVKPGKGAAFTRTKMKNLLTGAVLERNLRSGDKLEPADVETKTMQYLYADADSFIFMDTSTYDQVGIPKATIGESADYMPENINVEVLFFNARAVGVSLPNFIEQAIVSTDPGFRGRHRDGRVQARQDLDGRDDQRAALHQRRRRHQDRHAHRPVPRAPLPRLGRTAGGRGARDAGGARPHPARGSRLVRTAGVRRGRHAGARPLARPGSAHRRGPAGDGHWLITSPEYHMKRLVAAGLPRIVQIAKCWRAEESGPHHRGEFTMVEWYRANEPLETLADDCEALLRVAARAAGRDAAALGFAAPFARTTVRELWARHAGIDLTGDEDAPALHAKATAAGVALGNAEAWDDIFYQVFLDRIEPRLAAGGPTFVFDWPAPLAALARPKPGDPRVVERFELYAGRPGAGQRVRRADRSDRAAPPLRGRGAQSAPRGGGPPTRSTRRCWRRCPGCRPPRGSPWDSTGWSCSRSESGTSPRWSHSLTNEAAEPITLAPLRASCYASPRWRTS